MKLLRTICLDASDLFVFEKPAEPGEWAVSGAFAFAHCAPTSLQGKSHTAFRAFRAGFLGLSSFGRSTLVQIVEANEGDRRHAVDMLAARLVAHFGAPDLAAAREAAEEEIGFAASLCGHSPGVLVAVTRSHENGMIREVFRTLRPRNACPESLSGTTGARAASGRMLRNRRQSVAASQIAVIADGDGRENWQMMISWRDHLVKYRNMEAAYLDIVRRNIRFPPVLIEQLVHAILRSALDDGDDVFVLPAAEMFFRPQKLKIGEGSVVAVDEDTASSLDRQPRSLLVELLG